MVPGRPRAGHLHVGLERRPEGRRAHARHRDARAPTRFAALRGADERRAASVLLRVPVLLDRRHADPRRRAPVRGDRAVHRAVRARCRARPHRAEQATHGARAGRRCCRRCATTRRSPIASFPRSPGSPSAPPTSRSSSTPGARHPRAPRDERDRRQHHVGRAPGGRSRDRRGRARRAKRASCWIRGYGLMHGYYKKERAGGLRRRRLVAHRRPCVHARGRPYFVGRYTEMVKSQGANVAPREVELFLEETFDEVLYAFVLGMPHPERGEEVTAVLVPAQGHDDRPRRPAAPRPRADLGVQGADPHRDVGRRTTCRGSGRASPTSSRSAPASNGRDRELGLKTRFSLGCGDTRGKGRRDDEGRDRDRRCRRDAVLPAGSVAAADADGDGVQGDPARARRRRVCTIQDLDGFAIYSGSRAIPRCSARCSGCPRCASPRR